MNSRILFITCNINDSILSWQYADQNVFLPKYEPISGNLETHYIICEPYLNLNNELPNSNVIISIKPVIVGINQYSLSYSIGNINISNYNGNYTDLTFPGLLTGNIISNIRLLTTPTINESPSISDEFLLNQIIDNSEYPIFSATNKLSDIGNRLIINNPSIINQMKFVLQCENNQSNTVSWLGALSNWTISCLLKGTKVKTPFGYINIENLKVGDIVISHLEIPVKIIKKDSWKHVWSNNICKANRVYVIERNSGNTYLSGYHKYININKKKVTLINGKIKLNNNVHIRCDNKLYTPCNSDLRFATKEEICNEYGEYELFNIQIENYETNYLIVNNGTIVESWDGKYSEEKTKNINWLIK